MNRYQELVEEFHQETGSTVGQYPELRDAELRAKLILEEAVETVAAMGYAVNAEIHDASVPLPFMSEPIWSTDKQYKEPNFPDAIDGLADLLYVTFGSAIAWGIDLDPFFAEVHRANMDKLAGPKREDGKQLKPEGWRPPDIEKYLIYQQNLAEVWRDMAAEIWNEGEVINAAEIRHERLNNGEAAA